MAEKTLKELRLTDPQPKNHICGFLKMAYLTNQHWFMSITRHESVKLPNCFLTATRVLCRLMGIKDMIF